MKKNCREEMSSREKQQVAVAASEVVGLWLRCRTQQAFRQRRATSELAIRIVVASQKLFGGLNFEVLRHIKVEASEGLVLALLSLNTTMTVPNREPDLIQNLRDVLLLKRGEEHAKRKALIMLAVDAGWDVAPEDVDYASSEGGEES